MKEPKNKLDVQVVSRTPGTNKVQIVVKDQRNSKSRTLHVTENPDGTFTDKTKKIWRT